ncbi:MAG: hypothetical protein HOE90_15410 [Bacteriovoracaceae bacterium]|jgi:hypothetical protein|nr:hypothetical protein [Bacteriovoracaceae bacterium]
MTCLLPSVFCEEVQSINLELDVVTLGDSEIVLNKSVESAADTNIPQKNGRSWPYFYIGSGMSSATHSQVVPLIYSALQGDVWTLSFMSTGYQNSLMYQSNYLFSGFFQFPEKMIFGHSLFAGVGWGYYHYRLGFRSGKSEPKLEKINYATGPSMRAMYQIWGPAFIGVEAMFGIRGLLNIFNTYQSVANIVVGVKI